MNETASYRNIHLSIEKFLYPVAAALTDGLLINDEDIDIRLDELNATSKAVVWRTLQTEVSNKGMMVLQAGGTTKQDPGGMIRMKIFDAVKELFDVSGSIPVYRYDDDATPYELVNQLAIVGNIKLLPAVLETNGFKTKTLQVKLYFGQVRS